MAVPMPVVERSGRLWDSEAGGNRSGLGGGSCCVEELGGEVVLAE